MVKFITTFIFASMLILSARQAHAYRIGNFDLNLGAASSVSYDDNITYAKDDPKRDVIMDVTLALAAEYSTKTTTATLSAWIDQQIFTRYSKYTNTSEGFDFDLLKDFTRRDRLMVTDRFQHASEPRTFDDAFGAESGRYRYYRNRLAVKYEKDLTSQWGLAFNYGNQLDTFSRSDLADSYLNSAGASLRYFLTSKDIFSAGYSFAARTFDPGKTAYTNSTYLGARHYFTNQLYLDAAAGADFIDSFDRTVYAKPSFSFSLTDEMDKNTASSLAFRKQFNANAYAQDVFDYWELSGRFNRRLLKRVGASLTGFYGNGKYVNQDITDNLYGGRAGLSYEITRDFRANLSYTYAQTDSNTVSREYKKNTVTAGITGDF